MLKRILFDGFLGLMLVISVSSIPERVPEVVLAQTPGYSPFSPAEVGYRVETVVQCGNEPCDTRIVLLDVVRGKRAWERLKKEAAANKPAARDFEYVLARVKFEMSARTPGDKSFQIRSGQTGQFHAFSANGEPYEIPDVMLPNSAIEGILRSGDSLEGWVAFQIPQSEKKPLMNFDPAAGAARGQGRLIWFQLQ